MIPSILLYDWYLSLSVGGTSHTEEIKKLRNEAKIRSSRCRTASAERRWRQLAEETAQAFKHDRVKYYEGLCLATAVSAR